MHYVTSFRQEDTLRSGNQTLDPIPLPAGKGFLDRFTTLIPHQDLAVIVLLSTSLLDILHARHPCPATHVSFSGTLYFS